MRLLVVETTDTHGGDYRSAFSEARLSAEAFDIVLWPCEAAVFSRKVEKILAAGS